MNECFESGFICLNLKVSGNPAFSKKNIALCNSPNWLYIIPNPKYASALSN